MPRGTSHASAPRPRELITSQTSEPASTNIAPQAHPPTRRIGVNVACEACRKRKIRCSGNRPRCSSCVQRDAVCHYTSTNALETNSGVLKRRFKEVRQKSSDYEEFYRAVQSMPAKDCLAIFRLIREGADIKVVLRQIKEGNLLLQLSLVPETRRRYDFPFATAMPSALLTANNTYLQSLVYEATFYDQNNQRLSPPVAIKSRKTSLQHIYTQPYHSAEIVNMPLSSIDFASWTKVTTDNQLMRTLIYSYFLYEYPTYPVFQKDIFIQALIDGNKEFCSSLLVNAILAEASHCYTGIPHREQFWNPRTIGYRFLAEARRIWELQSEKTDLPTLQAALVIAITYANHGMDKLGFTYLRRSIAIAEELQLFRGNSHIHDKTLRHARDFTAWCLFNWQTILGYYYYRPPLISNPPLSALPDPNTEPSWYGDFVLKYPSNSTLVSLHFPHSFIALSKLRTIVNIMGAHIFKKENIERTLPPKLKSDLLAQLDMWLAKLPPPLHPANIVFPLQLKLHMEYQIVTFSLLQTPVTHEWSSALLHIDQTTHDTGILQGAMTIAMLRLETIARLYYLRHSYEFCDTFLAYFLSVLGLSALEGLKTSPGDHERLKHLRSTIILCAKGIYDQGQHIHSALAVYRLLRDRLPPQDLELVEGFIHWDLKGDEDPLIIEHIQSQWPMGIVGQEKDPEASTLENLARRYNEMTVKSSKKTSQENEL